MKKAGRQKSLDVSSLRAEFRWLEANPPLHELMERHPAEWEQVGPKLVSSLENGGVQILKGFAIEAKSLEKTWMERLRKDRNNLNTLKSALPCLIRSRMSLLAVDKCLFSAATGVATGPVRFNWLNGYVMQQLLFRHDLIRKPVSLRWFRFWWRMNSQKRLLMPLVQKKGIYCFYTRELIKALAMMIGRQSCLEIAAGDGTLSRFLAEEGVNIAATDNQSWQHAIEYPDDVQKIEAKQALQRYQPEVVICSWPPPANHFERHVFSTNSVQLYVVIGSRYQFASGNWGDYAKQGNFDYTIDPELSALVVPPELESAVLIFRRQSSS